MTSDYEEETYIELEQEITKHLDMQLGAKLIEVLQLKVKPNGRVDTAWGDKTPLGLARVVRRLIEEN